MKKFLPIIFNLFISLLFTSCSQDSNGKFNNDPGELIGYYEVDFNTNGGSKVPSQTTNEIRTEPYTSKEGYIFDGWFFDENFITPAIFPLKLKNDTTLYAKWLLVSYSVTCCDSEIKFMDDDYSNSTIWYISPIGIDYDRLEELGYYKIKIIVEYNVYYKKDYDVLWDIGYAGSPKYELYILNSDDVGVIKNDLTTTTTSKKNRTTYSSTLSTIKNTNLRLKFSTDNVQNIIYFENITIFYECLK